MATCIPLYVPDLRAKQWSEQIYDYCKGVRLIKENDMDDEIVDTSKFAGEIKVGDRVRTFDGQSGVVIEKVAEEEEIKVGDRVRITSGEFEGQLGTITTIDQGDFCPFLVKLDSGDSRWFKEWAVEKIEEKDEVHQDEEHRKREVQRADDYADDYAEYLAGGQWPPKKEPDVPESYWDTIREVYTKGEKKMEKKPSRLIRAIRNYMMIASLWTTFCIARWAHPVAVAIANNLPENESFVWTPWGVWICFFGGVATLVVVGTGVKALFSWAYGKLWS